MIALDFLQKVLIKPKGKFIVFEAPDGSGKTTQAKLLVERLVDEGIKAIYTCEPTESIDFYLNKYQNCKYPELQAYLEDRDDHKDSIKEHLLAGTTVVCDRYNWSTLAYQREALSNADAQELYFYYNFLQPDIYIYLDDSLKNIWQSLQQREQLSKYESLDNLKAIEATYKEIVTQQLKIDSQRVLIAPVNVNKFDTLSYILGRLKARHFFGFRLVATKQ